MFKINQLFIVSLIIQLQSSYFLRKSPSSLNSEKITEILLKFKNDVNRNPIIINYVDIISNNTENGIDNDEGPNNFLEGDFERLKYELEIFEYETNNKIYLSKLLIGLCYLMGINFFSCESICLDTSGIYKNGLALISEDDFIDHLILNDQLEFLYMAVNNIKSTTERKIYNTFGSVNIHPSKIDTYKKLYNFFTYKIAIRLNIINEEAEKFICFLFEKERLLNIFGRLSEKFSITKKEDKINYRTSEELIENLDRTKCAFPLESLKKLYKQYTEIN